VAQKGLIQQLMRYIIYSTGPPAYCGAIVCFVSLGLCTLEPMLLSVALTIVRLDGTPILSLYNIDACRYFINSIGESRFLYEVGSRFHINQLPSCVPD
jgi:hypothetical protein